MSNRVASLFAEIGASTTGFEQGAGKVKSGLTSLKGGMSELGLSSVASFLTIGGAIAGTVAAIKNVSDETLKYAGEVRDLSLASGTTAEQSSRLLQVLDDYQISAQDVTTAMRAMKEKGIVPTIDSLAALSDQFLAIQDPAQRLKFAQENLGRSSAVFMNVLSQGSSKIRENSAAVNESLILTTQQVRETERYRLVLDNVKDTGQGWKVAIVTGFLDAQEAQDNFSAAVRAGLLVVHDTTRGGNEYSNAVSGLNNEISRAKQYGLAWEDALKKDSAALKDTGASAEDYNKDLGNLNEILSGDLGKAQDDYNAKLAEYNQQLTLARTQKEKDTINANIAAEKKDYDERADAIIFNIEQERILNSTELTGDQKIKMVTALGQAYGQWDEATAHVIVNTNDLITSVENGSKTEQQAIKLLRAAAVGYQAMGSAAENQIENVHHLSERERDGADSAALLQKSQTLLAKKINAEAEPAVHSLVGALNQMPLTGTQWEYDFWIRTHGAPPSMPTSAAGNNTYGAGGPHNPDTPGGGHAMGGLILGAGTSTSDSISTHLSSGEYVLRAAAVNRIGTQQLDAINQGSGNVTHGPYIHAENINVYTADAEEFYKKIIEVLPYL